MKKIILLLSFTIISLALYVDASSMEFYPSEGSFGKGCIVGVDVNIDTQGATVSTFDLIMESSMEFYDFVPSKMFSYHFPPVSRGSLIHVVGFFTEPNDFINGSGSIGKVYFKPGNSDIDGAIRFYFVGEGSTVDSNVTMPGGIDTLTSVKNGYYTFTSDGECIDEHSIIGGYSGVSYQSGLTMVMNKIDSDYKKLKMTIFWERVGVIGVSIIILLLILWYLHKKGYLVRHKVKASHN